MCPVAKRKILVVDDEKDILFFIQHCLIEKGYEIITFANPIDALEYFKNNPRDCQLVISDIRMPGMKGITFSRNIKAIDSDTKIILMTAFEVQSEEFEQVLPSVKIDGFIRKPFTSKQLVNKINQVLN